MSWYLTKVIYRIICGTGDHKAQFDEQLRLVEASSKQEAFEKARAIGKKEQIIFRNEKQQQVQWKFVDVCEVYQLHEIVDGTEIYSRIEEKDDAAFYEDVVHKKAHYLLAETEVPHLQLS
ncbi:MAG: DUF4288 domain-containing protein [Bacteroidota bacterium]|nr:DUF4288 domain-containing protein [Bacteroidota bacterium]